MNRWEIDQLVADVAGLNAAVATLADQVAQLQSQLTDQHSQGDPSAMIDALAGEVAALQSQVSTSPQDPAPAEIFDRIPGPFTPGEFHVRGALGGAMYFEADSIGADPVTVIHDDNPDVTHAVYVMFHVDAVDENACVTSTAIITPGHSSDQTPSISTLSLRVNVDGSLDVRRSSGTATFRVALWALWM